MTTRRSGFTLVEVLLAMVIAVVLLTVIGSAMGTAHRTVTGAERRAGAVRVAERRLAELESGELTLTQSAQQAVCEEDPLYAWSLEAAGTGDLRDITIRVTWTETGRELFSVVRLFRDRR